MLYRWRKKYMPDGDKTQLAQQQDELSELRRRNAELKEETTYQKKRRPFLREIIVKTTDFYDLIQNEIQYAKTKWAERLGASTSGFYAWLHDRNRRKASGHALRKKVISVFEEGQGVYGAKRICGIFRRNGDSASYLVVKRIMSQAAVFDK